MTGLRCCADLKGVRRARRMFARPLRHRERSEATQSRRAAPLPLRPVEFNNFHYVLRLWSDPSLHSAL